MAASSSKNFPNKNSLSVLRFSSLIFDYSLFNCCRRINLFKSIGHASPEIQRSMPLVSVLLNLFELSLDLLHIDADRVRLKIGRCIDSCNLELHGTENFQEPYIQRKLG